MTTLTATKKGTTVPARMGRPPATIDWKLFDELCELQCTEQEIADFFRCHLDTLAKHVQREWGFTFPEYYATKKGDGKISLRRQLRDHAKKNIAACIFSAKNILGYADKQEVITKVYNVDVSAMYQAYFNAQDDFKALPPGNTPQLTTPNVPEIADKCTGEASEPVTGTITPTAQPEANVESTLSWFDGLPKDKEE